MDKSIESVKALADLADRVESATPVALGRAALIVIFQTARPRSSFSTGKESDVARNQFISLWEIGGSLDAAMMLVPEGHVGRIGYGPDGSGFNWAFCTKHAAWMAGDDLPRANGATPALALTAAALRAHAHLGASHV